MWLPHTYMQTKYFISIYVFQAIVRLHNTGYYNRKALGYDAQVKESFTEGLRGKNYVVTCVFVPLQLLATRKQ